MVDSLRHDLIQVVRRCGMLECVLNQPELNKILNGKFQQVIDDYKKRPVARKAQKIETPVELVQEPVHSDNDQKDDEDLTNSLEVSETVPVQEPEVIRNNKFF